MIIGLITSIFGLSLILFKRIWRIFTKRYGNVHAESNNWFMRVLHTDKAVKYTGTDDKYSASDKGMNIIGLFFLIFGLIIIALPYIN